MWNWKLQCKSDRPAAVNGTASHTAMPPFSNPSGLPLLSPAKIACKIVIENARCALCRIQTSSEAWIKPNSK
jgi:hypothetical protein